MLETFIKNFLYLKVGTVILGSTLLCIHLFIDMFASFVIFPPHHHCYIFVNPLYIDVSSLSKDAELWYSSKVGLYEFVGSENAMLLFFERVVSNGLIGWYVSHRNRRSSIYYNLCYILEIVIHRLRFLFMLSFTCFFLIFALIFLFFGIFQKENSSLVSHIVTLFI